MKCLLVKPPFAGWIVDGVKPVEYRRIYTYIRDRIGIMQTGPVGTNPNIRAILGDVKIINCVFDTKTGLYQWMFREPREYRYPVFIPPIRGAQVFVNIDYLVPDEFSAVPTPYLHNIAREECDAEERRAIRELQAKGPVKMRRVCNA